MIRINQLKLPITHTEEELKKKAAKALRISPSQIQNLLIIKQSIDARKKPELSYVYTVDVAVEREAQILKKQKQGQITKAPEKTYQFRCTGEKSMQHAPVVIGSGPAGLFCAYMLAKAGYQPLLLERGASVEERMEDVKHFWETGVLNPESNVQFGEGGAGTFSDGKLNTLVKDPFGRNRKVLEIFMEHGAPEEILYVNKPHIGTDILTTVVKNLRDAIQRAGGTVLFHSQVTDMRIEDGKLRSVIVNQEKEIPCELAVLAIGHSARDTFETLYDRGLPMEAKSFAIGVRVEHKQTMINESQYGVPSSDYLSAAPYKVAEQLENGRGVYSFCMCPGGYVVNASSEEGRLAVNGMSYHDRAGENANSAIIVTVTPEDFQSQHPLAGVAFQRRLEERAYRLADGKIPVQLYGDFCKNRMSEQFGDVRPQMKGSYAFANVRNIFPPEIADSIAEGMKKFNDKIKGFSREDTVLSGVESRTSSPVRIVRNESLMSEIMGIYPCGEGAGYAGGITSAAMDGIKIAEKIAETYKPVDENRMGS